MVILNVYSLNLKGISHIVEMYCICYSFIISIHFNVRFTIGFGGPNTHNAPNEISLLTQEHLKVNRENDMPKYINKDTLSYASLLSWYENLIDPNNFWHFDMLF